VIDKELETLIAENGTGMQREYVPSEDGTTRAIVTRRMGATGMNLQPPIRTPMQQAEPRDMTAGEAAAEIGTATAGLATGAVAGAVGLPGDIASLLYGSYKAAFPGQDEGRAEAFVKGVETVSNAAGSEAALNLINSVIPIESMNPEMREAYEQAQTAGTFVGMGKATKGATAATKEFIAGAPARVAARETDTGVTLAAGVDPTPAIDRMIAKATAPKDDKPGIIAFHGSGADFDEFKVDKIGTGEGAQAYGYGLYFTDSEDIAKYYRSAVTGMDRYNQPDLDTQAGGFTEELGFDTVGGTHSLSSADPDYDYYIGELDKFAVNKSENLSENSKTWEFEDGSELTLQTEGVMTFNGKPLDSVYTRDVEDRFGVDIKRIAEEAKNFGIRDDVGTLEDDIGMIFSNLGQGIFNKRDAKTAVESLAGPSGPGAPSRYETIYKYFIEPKIDMTRVDYLMNAGQKKGKMYKVGLEPKPEDMLDYDLPLSQQPKFEKVLAPIYEEYGVAKTADIGTLFESIKSQRGIMPKDLSKKLSDAGIPGIKYRAAGSRGAGIDDAAAKRNYVIFDDKMIKILEKYGIVGPVSIAAMNAVSGDESEADNGA